MRIELLLLLAACATACSETVVQQASGSATGSGGSSTTSAGAGGSDVCGGPDDVQCPPDRYCDYTGKSPCGICDNCEQFGPESGVCLPRPASCPMGCDPQLVCGCDGKLYCNECLAHQGGTDVGEHCTMLSCTDATTALETELWAFGPAAEITVAVRMDAASFDLLGFAMVGGFSHATTEAEARATANKDTMIPLGANLLSAPMPDDEFVFQAFGPEESALTAVSGRSGLTVLGADWIMASTTTILYPAAWQPPGDLGVGCTPQDPLMPPARGVGFGADGPMIVATALAKLWTTALPDAMSHLDMLDVVVVPIHSGPTGEVVALVNVATPAP